MKNYAKAGILALITTFALSGTTMASDTCPETKSDLKKLTLTVDKVHEEHNMLFITYTDATGKHSMQVSYGDKAIYESVVGLKVDMEYWDLQFFNEMDGECEKSRQVKSIDGQVM